MTNADPDVIVAINALGERRLSLEQTKSEIVAQHKAELAVLNAAFEEEARINQEEIDEVDALLVKKITESRSTLIAKNRQSFTTTSVVFQFRKSAAKVKVSDAKGILAVARKLRIVRKFFVEVRTWKLDADAFAKWFEKHGEYRAQLEDYLEDVPESESLSIKANGYTVLHDGERISPPNVKIEIKS